MSTTRGQGRTKKEKWFWDDWVAPGPAKKKAMLALMMREMVRVLITNHHYTVDGKLFHQCKGGPIGERITTVLARMVLHLFDNEFQGALSRLDLSLALLQRYVDDMNGAGRKLDRKLAVEVRDGQAELVMGEEDTNSADDAFAAKIYQAVANTIRPKSIVMEVDFPSNNPKGCPYWICRCGWRLARSCSSSTSSPWPRGPWSCQGRPSPPERPKTSC